MKEFTAFLKFYLDNTYCTPALLNEIVKFQTSLYTLLMKYQIHTDGGSRGNPGPAAIGIVIESETGPVHSLGKVIGVATNNVAEYRAVLEALEYLKTTPLSNVESIAFFLDSLLVVEQLNGRYKMKNAGLIPLFTKIQSLRSSLSIPITFSHIPREQNSEADSLVNQALDNNISS